MHHVHQHPIRSSLLAGTVVMAIGLFSGATAAQAAPVLCTVSAGVQQTETTVTGTDANDTITCPANTTVATIDGRAGNDTITGSNDLINYTINGGDGNDTITSGAGNDTINGGLGKDTLTGSAGNDIVVGSGVDGSQDTLNGGDGIDNCQSPPEDIINGCETTPPPPTTGPGSATTNAADLCRAVGGTFLAVNPVGYTCWNIPVNKDHRAAEARKICVDGFHLVFLDVKSPLRLTNGYSCLARRL